MKCINCGRSHRTVSRFFWLKKVLTTIDFCSEKCLMTWHKNKEFVLQEPNPSKEGYDIYSVQTNKKTDDIKELNFHITPASEIEPIIYEQNFLSKILLKPKNSKNYTVVDGVALQILDYKLLTHEDRKKKR